MSKFKFNETENEELWGLLSPLSHRKIDTALTRIEQIVSERDGWIDVEAVWQKCPKCDGQGKVSKPPWIAGDVYEWSSTSVSHQCNVCNGAMIIPSPPKQP